MTQDMSKPQEGKLLNIGLVSGYQGGIASSDPDFIQYHLRPMNPTAELKGAVIEGRGVVVIDDPVDISNLIEGDRIRYTQELRKCSKIGSSFHWDYKELPVITNIEKIQ